MALTNTQRVQRSWASELIDARNRWAHNEAFSTNQAYRALDTAQLLLNAVGAASWRRRSTHCASALASPRRSARCADPLVSRGRGAPAAGLRPWREVVTPRSDVASGRLACARPSAAGAGEPASERLQ